jgi:phosphoglycerol transferase MdoB-like AlkP superfamily enzyme
MNMRKIALKGNAMLVLMTRLMALSLVLGFLTRVVLLFSPRTVISFTFVEWFKIFGLGLVNDIGFAFLLLVPLFVICAGFVERKYARPWGYIIEIVLLAAVVYVYFLPSVFNEYGGGAPKIAKIFLTYKLLSFSLRLFLPRIRSVWRRWEVRVVVFLYVFVLLFNCISEYCFWDEFGVRYNFIAVDYLVYTSEVIGNIFESYPMIPIIMGVSAFSVLITWLLLRRSHLQLDRIWSLKSFVAHTVVFTVVVVLGFEVLMYNRLYAGCNNLFATELQSNGGFDFYLAFRSNELKYDQFYPTLPEQQCRKELHKLLTEGNDSLQLGSLKQKVVKKNIVLITVESLSASFLKDYGNKDGLTPNLDTLMQRSLVFDNLYAVGNRTVRGLEALSLCLPPSSGESIIKRAHNTGLFSVGKLLRNNGYRVQFLYGGDSYFDNMGAFFGGNGYEVVDKKNFNPAKIRFSNIWGVCDEDAYDKLLAVADEDNRSGKPFFVNMMTISNHRPYTFPAGKIKMNNGDVKSRNGGVKYTDFAIGQFLKEARHKSWFKETVFIIVADHCASSAGATDIPIDDYHIPALVYSPGFIQPGRISKLCSQMDLMPTILSLLHFSERAHFIGRNVLSPSFRPRAFMATYQNLGYWENNCLTVLSPVRRVEQYDVKQLADGSHSETLRKHPVSDYVRRAEVYYQDANLYALKRQR